MSDKITKRLLTILETQLKGQEKIKEFKKNLEAVGMGYENLSESAIKNALKQEEIFKKKAAKERKANKKFLEEEQRKKIAQEAQAKFLYEWSKKSKRGISGVKKAMSEAGLSFNKNGDVVNLFGKKVKNVDDAMKKGLRTTKKFNMNMLGTMFAGMAITRVFGGLIKSQLELWGITDLFSSMWTVVFLPVMESILPIILKIVEWFMNLSETTRKNIGIFVIAAAIFGTLLTVVGSVALAIKSISGIIQDFLPLDLLNNVEIFGFSLGEAGGSLEKILSIIITVAGALGLFTTTLGTVSAATSDNEKTQKSFFEKIKGFFNGFIEKAGGMIDNVKGIGGSISETIGNIVNEAVFIVKKGINKIKDFILIKFPEIWKDLKPKVPKPIRELMEIVEGTIILWCSDKSVIEKIGGTLFNLVKSITIWGEIGVYIAQKMIEGIINKFKNSTSFLTYGIDDIVKDVIKNKLNKGEKKNDLRQSKINLNIPEIKVKKSHYSNDFFNKPIEKNPITDSIIKNDLRQSKINLNIPKIETKKNSFLSSIFNAGKSGIFDITKKILGFKTGGIMPNDGLAYLHKGEKVVPQHEVGLGSVGGPNIIINANISSDYDVRRLADQLKKYWVNDFERVSQGRSI